MAKKVCLFGTCNETSWRDKLIPLLTIDFFNPVVEDWTPEHQANEIAERANADYILYVLTPKMTGVFSIAELIDDSNKIPEKTLFAILPADVDEGVRIVFNPSVKKSIDAVAALAVKNGAKQFDTLQEIADYLNNQGKE